MKLLFFILVLSCATSKTTPPKTNEPTSEVFRFDLINLSGFTDSEKEKMKRVILNTEKIVFSKDFDSKVLGFKFNGENKFHYTEKSNKEVLELLKSKPWVIDYRKEWLWAKSTIAYTYPSISYVVINSRRFGELLESDISANICHEIGGHKVGGFDHEKKWNKKRDYSVPYGIGSICSELYKLNYGDKK